MVKNVERVSSTPEGCTFVAAAAASPPDYLHEMIDIGIDRDRGGVRFPFSTLLIPVEGNISSRWHIGAVHVHDSH